VKRDKGEVKRENSTMKRFLHSAAVLSFESTMASVEMARVSGFRWGRKGV
jgi:hypothetical protein